MVRERLSSVRAYPQREAPSIEEQVDPPIAVLSARRGAPDTTLRESPEPIAEFRTPENALNVETPGVPMCDTRIRSVDDNEA